MKNLLVPTDFSSNTHAALNYAIDLANKFGAKITLLHTYKLGQRAGVFIGVEKMMKKEALEDMAKQIEQFSGKLVGSASITGEVVKGDAVPTVIRAAGKLEADLIVMGTQGASGLKEVFIGSTTNGVIKSAKVPVLAVPSTYPYQPLDGMVLCVDDRTEYSATLLQPFIVIARHYGAKIEAMHINNGKSDQSIEDKVCALFTEVSYEYHEETRDESIKISDQIAQFVDRTEADMICLVRHDRGLIGNFLHSSVTTSKVFHSKVPILVLHD